MRGREQPGMVGRKFEQWVVLKYYAGMSLAMGRDYYLCRCECLREKSVCGRNLRTGKSQSCGCYRADMPKTRRIDLMCQKFGRWRVVQELGTGIRGQAIWLCKCDCREERVIRCGELRSGRTKSCGCYRADRIRELWAGVSGPDHPKYAGGVRAAAIKFYDEMRRRDNYICQDCGKTQEQELKDTGKILHIHHKDSNHYNDVPPQRPDALSKLPRYHYAYD